APCLPHEPYRRGAYFLSLENRQESWRLTLVFHDLCNLETLMMVMVLWRQLWGEPSQGGPNTPRSAVCARESGTAKAGDKAARHATFYRSHNRASHTVHGFRTST